MHAPCICTHTHTHIYTACIGITIVTYFSIRCVPSLKNNTCDGFGVESYAIEVAQDKLNIAIVDIFKSARSEVLSSDIDPVCTAILDLIICFYRFPPCLDFKLLLPCATSCGEILRFFVICYDSIAEHINDRAIVNHFSDYRCRVAESYYRGYDSRYFKFNDAQCIDIPNGQYNLFLTYIRTYV